jgi:TRAP-type C4-dicarboxylate transport system permease small subunit
MTFEPLVRRNGWADRATRWITAVGFTALIGVALLTMADVLLRWLFNSPLEGLEDLNRYTFAVAIATCLPAGLIQGHNVTIRFLGPVLGKRATLWLEVLAALATLVFFGLLAWRFAVFSRDETVAGRFTLTLEMATAPWWWTVTAVIVIAVLVQCLISIVRIDRAIAGRLVAEQHGETPEYLAGLDDPPNGKPTP